MKNTSLGIDPQKFQPSPTVVTYPPEYYILKNKADSLSITSGSIVFNPDVSVDYRTKAILIALEKQNELIAEQNNLLKSIINGHSKCLNYRKSDGICQVFAWENG